MAHTTHGSHLDVPLDACTTKSQHSDFIPDCQQKQLLLLKLLIALQFGVVWQDGALLMKPPDGEKHKSWCQHVKPLCLDT